MCAHSSYLPECHNQKESQEWIMNSVIVSINTLYPSVEWMFADITCFLYSVASVILPNLTQALPKENLNYAFVATGDT